MNTSLISGKNNFTSNDNLLENISDSNIIDSTLFELSLLAANTEQDMTNSSAYNSGDVEMDCAGEDCINDGKANFNNIDFSALIPMIPNLNNIIKLEGGMSGKLKNIHNYSVNVENIDSYALYESKENIENAYNAEDINDTFKESNNYEDAPKNTPDLKKINNFNNLQNFASQNNNNLGQIIINNVEKNERKFINREIIDLNLSNNLNAHEVEFVNVDNETNITNFMVYSTKGNDLSQVSEHDEVWDYKQSSVSKNNVPDLRYISKNELSIQKNTPALLKIKDEIDNAITTLQQADKYIDSTYQDVGVNSSDIKVTKNFKDDSISNNIVLNKSVNINDGLKNLIVDNATVKQSIDAIDTIDTKGAVDAKGAIIQKMNVNENLSINNNSAEFFNKEAYYNQNSNDDLEQNFSQNDNNNTQNNLIKSSTNINSDFTNIIGLQSDIKNQNSTIQENRHNTIQYKTFTNVTIKEYPNVVMKYKQNLTNEMNAVARLIMNPESLGTVFVEISSNETKVTINFKADNKETLEAIEKNIGSLKDLLVKNGTNDIEYRFERQDKNQQEQFFDRNNQDKNNRHDEQNARRNFINSFTKIMQQDESQQTMPENEVKKRFMHGRIIEKYI